MIFLRDLLGAITAVYRRYSVKSDKRFGYFKAIVFLVLAVMPAQVLSQPVEQVLSLAKKEKPALLETLKDLVSVESGSRDNEGLDKLANLIAGRLKSLDGQVELVEPSNTYKTVSYTHLT